MLRIKPVLTVILLIQLLTSCMQNNPSDVVEDVDAWIDPSIQGRERMIIAIGI
jgi:hypothetical protein